MTIKELNELDQFVLDEIRSLSINLNSQNIEDRKVSLAKLNAFSLVSYKIDEIQARR